MHELITDSGRTHREEISEDEILQQYETEERHRRDQWTHQYGFEGVTPVQLRKKPKPDGG